MSYLREIERLRSEVAGLRERVSSMPEDIFAKPLMVSRLREQEAELAELEKNPRATPEAELLFAGGPVFGSLGIDAKFAGKALDAYQDMVTNHYGASRHGVLGNSGRRKGDAEARLCLSALPRGSFGLLLTQPQATDFVASAQLADVMDQITSLLESAASGDAAFTDTVERFHPRVLKPLGRFLETLENQNATVRVRSGTRQCNLKTEQVKAAKERVDATKPETTRVQLHGVCRGVLLESWKFDFNPDGQPPISGQISENVSDDAAKAMWALVDKAAVAEIEITRMRTRSGFGRPTYELLDLKLAPVAP